VSLVRAKADPVIVRAVNESGIYTEADLKPYQSRLAELKLIINEGAPSEDDGRDETDRARDTAMTKLLLAKWDACDRLVTKLASSLSQLAPELFPLHQRLITLRRTLAGIAARPRPSAADVAPILAELRQIEDKRQECGGKLAVEIPSASSIAASAAADEAQRLSGEVFAPDKGQELLAGLLQDNFDICEDIKAREGEHEVARGPLQPIYDRLSEIRAQLERLVLTHRWTLRETVRPPLSLSLPLSPRRAATDDLLHARRTCTTTRTSSRGSMRCGSTARCARPPLSG